MEGGLGLRNVAWMGGVSWRRTDGIIGILKKEWEFAEKVYFPPSEVSMALVMMNYYSISLEDFQWLKLFCLSDFLYKSFFGIDRIS